MLKLEQNYRSTKNIIKAANKVVNKNDFGIKLEMFCDNEQGELIQHHASPDTSGEAKWITSEIMVNRQLMGKNYSDYAIIYRANYQSREMEDCLTREGIPYVVFGATSFYARKETRDLLAYCKMITNPLDREAFGRVLGTLPGVGKQTVEKIMSISNNSYDALRQFVSNPPPKSTAKSIMSLESVLNVMSTPYNKCSEIVDAVIANTDYRAKYSNSDSDDALESVEIIDEFSDMVKAMEKESPDDGILEIIDKISLLSDAKGAEKEKQDAVKLMTAHASKGLEFDTVYVIGCEEGSFPHINSIESSNPKDSIEEERRLFYVAMTRAKKKLYITNSLSKFKKGVGTVKLKPSRFISEIPDELLEEAI